MPSACLSYSYKQGNLSPALSHKHIMKIIQKSVKQSNAMLKSTLKFLAEN